MPYSIHWGAQSGSLFENIELMLESDIPVILAVGPNFPLFWQKNNLPFYRRESDGTLVKSCARPRTLRGRHGDGRGVAAHIVMGQGVLYKPRGIHGLRQEAQPPHTQQHRSHKTQSALILL